MWNWNCVTCIHKKFHKSFHTDLTKKSHLCPSPYTIPATIQKNINIQIVFSEISYSYFYWAFIYCLIKNIVIFNSVTITPPDPCYDSNKHHISTGIMSPKCCFVTLIKDQRWPTSCCYLPLNNLTGTGTAALLFEDHHFLICGKKKKECKNLIVNISKW